MVSKVRRNWIDKWPHFEMEILSASHEGITRAVFYFDPTKSISFSRCCILQVNKYIKREIEKEMRFRGFMKTLLGRVESLHVAGRRADPWAERGR